MSVRRSRGPEGRKERCGQWGVEHESKSAAGRVGKGKDGGPVGGVIEEFCLYRVWKSFKVHA